MNVIETSVYETVVAELILGEARLSAIAWELQETHGLQDFIAVREAALRIVAQLLQDGDIGVYELRSDFVAWEQSGAVALSRLVEMRTREDRGSPIRTFGWDDEPQLFLLRRSVCTAYRELPRAQRRWWQLWSRGT